MPSSLGSRTHTSDIEPARFVHTLESQRLLPSSSQWKPVEIESQSSMANSSLPSPYSKSYEFNLVITDKNHFKRCLYISASTVFLILATILLVKFWPQKHHHHGPPKNLTLALHQALTFFDAQKSGAYPNNSPVRFRGNSGLQDGSSGSKPANLTGGFYDSGNNIKFTLPTAYTVTLLSWTVIEYHEKYADIGELDHVKDIIKWGSDYLLKVFVPQNTTSATTLYSQIGSANSTDANVPNDFNCWERPEDMDYERPVFICDNTASDLAGEIVAALSAASLVFKEDNVYSAELIQAAEKLFESATTVEAIRQGTYTAVEACGGESRNFYNSSGYRDELVWGGTWLFLATGNNSHLGYATKEFESAANQTSSDKGVFYWNNKLNANAVLLTRLQYFRDPGFPYEDSLDASSDMTGSLMCSYVSTEITTPGGLIIQRPNHGGFLEYAATASFLSKLYSDYLDLLRISGGSCSGFGFSVNMLRNFSMSQVNYILGDNPMKMSYVVGFGDKFPTQVHHRSASIPWDGQHYSCKDGERWQYSKDPNPNLLLGAMVAGPDQQDKFIDERDKKEFTEPSIASNAGLVAALIALHDPPKRRSPKTKGMNSGIDQMGIFDKIL